MRSLTTITALVFVTSATAIPGVAIAKTKCKTKGKKAEVFVTGKTPVRRGPGLNYPVASFLERGTCAPYSEVSLDKSWVLVDINDKLGWVPSSRLSAISRELISGVKTPSETAPVGSGQRRGFGSITKQTVMHEAPLPNAAARRVLPNGSEVLLLAKTEDGKWIQIRDDRGDVGWIMVADVAGKSLSDLPNADASMFAKKPPDSSGQVPDTGTSETVSETSSAADGDRGPKGNEIVGGRPAPGSGLEVRASVFGAALLPTHSLDSNGLDAVRRYDVASFTPGTGIEIALPKLGPIAVRASYVIGFLVGVAPEEAPNVAIGGTQHDAAFRIGAPIDSGAIMITPEVGYAFGMFDFGALLPGRVGTTFLSTQTHAATVGARLQTYVSSSVQLEADVGGLFGFTSESPLTLGDSSLTIGGVAAVGALIGITDTVSFAARYALNYRSTGYSGAGTLDETIGEATLVDFTHGALIGMSFTLSD